MTCKNCNSEWIAEVEGKVADSCTFRVGHDVVEGADAPPDVGLGGGGDYIELKYCLECGMIQSDDFPADPEVVQAILDKEY